MKNFLFQILILCRKATYNTLGFIDRSFPTSQSPVFILSYHSVSNDTWRFGVSETVIKKQILYLQKHFEIITLKSLNEYLQGKRKITKPSVVLTFDDGYKDILKLKSFFAKNKIIPALFVLSNSKKPNWKELGSKRPFLTTKEVKTLKKANWEIGCHSATHANLTMLSKEQLEEEIVHAKKVLEKDLGFSLPYFAYPRGKYNEDVVRLVKKAKYQLGLTMDDGIINVRSDVLKLPRVGIDRTHSFAEFASTFSPSVVKFRGFIKRSPVGRYL